MHSSPIGWRRRARRSTPPCARPTARSLANAAGRSSTGAETSTRWRRGSGRSSSRCWQDDAVTRREVGPGRRPGPSGRAPAARRGASRPRVPPRRPARLGHRRSGALLRRRGDRARRRPHVGPRVARTAPGRDRDRPGRQPDSCRARAGDHRRGVQQPDRGRPQGDHRVRGRASQRGRGQQAPEDARRTAGERAPRARDRGRRPAVADDPVPVPARRLREPRAGTIERVLTDAGVAPDARRSRRAARGRAPRSRARARRAARRRARRVRRLPLPRSTARERGRRPRRRGAGSDAGGR